MPPARAARKGGRCTILEFVIRHRDEIVVAPARDRAVAGEVLQRRNEAALAKSRGARGGEIRTEQNVLARAFHRAAPARVAADIGHGREGPVDAGWNGLSRRQFGVAGGETGIEARGLGQRHGKKGAEAVQQIEADQKRDAETGFAGFVLGLGDGRRVVEADDGTGFSPLDHIRSRGLVEADHDELADLLLQGHACDQRAGTVRCLLRRRRSCRPNKQAKCKG